jgi:organic hydroperoxide reductase OsmC/OhrA
MAQHTATVEWSRRNETFTDNRYSREHHWRFDGGANVLASASPHVVPVPLSNPAGVDPEEAYVAALSSCHMLWFLSIAAKQGWVIERYRDEAVGLMEKNAEGRIAMTRVTLRPKIDFEGPKPMPEQLAKLHHEAHESCFLASSVKTEITVVPA